MNPLGKVNIRMDILPIRILQRGTENRNAIVALNGEGDVLAGAGEAAAAPLKETYNTASSFLSKSYLFKACIHVQGGAGCVDDR